MALAALLGPLLLVAAPAAAQQICGSDYQQQYQNADAQTRQRMDAVQQHTDAYLSSGSASRFPAQTITIPVVVHVVYRTAAENVSDAQIQSQMDVLREDFRLQNADRINIPAPFAPLAADYGIQFVLASVDPNGNATNGITRTSTSVSAFGQNDAVKFDDQGGKNAWPTDRYLNLWVCNLDGGLLGYAQFPGGAPATDGIVVKYTAFGRGGSAQAPYNLGRIATHEVGHWLNLRHIWGDANCGNDFVNDTPTQQTANRGCPSFPRVTCGNGPNGDMFMNYMDYTANACMFMFTNGQKARSEALFAPGGLRASFNNCPSDLTIGQPVVASGRYKAANRLWASSAIASGLSQVYQAGNEVVLADGFSVDASSAFRAVIADCSTNARPTLENAVAHQKSDKAQPVADRVAQPRTLALYPNPATDEVTVSAGGKDAELTIYDSRGTVRKEVRLQAAADNTVSVRDLPDGLYHVRVASKGRPTVEQQLVVQH